MPISLNQASLLRNVKSNVVVPGQSLTVDLDKGYDIMSVGIRIHGDITIATAAATALKGFGMANILARVEMFADGRRTFEETNGILAAFANFERALRRNIVDPGLTVATHPVDITFRLDRATMDGMRPKDSALHTSLPYMSLLQLRMTFGALSDILTPAGTTVLSSSLTVDVIQDEIQELNIEDATEGRMVRVVSLQEIDVDSNNSNRRIVLPTGNFLRGCKIAAVNDTGAPDDTVVNNVKIARGTDVRLDVPFTQLRQQNADDYEIPQSDLVTGVAYADLARKAPLKRLYDLRAASQADLVLDVTKPAGGNGKVYIAVVQYFEQDRART